MTVPVTNTSSADYSAIVKVTPFTQTISTELLFDRSYKLSKLSPIDEFIENANKLNLLWIVRDEEEITSEFSNILFLGYFSAVESYIRALVRTLIHNDIYSSRCAEKQQITFGAALHHNKKLLPEALMDHYSFTASDNIVNTFKNLADISIAIDDVTVSELDKICQLRHCCVHRFGKLGAKNAMALGLTSHSNLFEKPLILTKIDLVLLSSTLRSIVKTINNSVYKAVLDRTFPVQSQTKGVKQKLERPLWSKDYETDKELFATYYKMFSSRKESSPPVKEMYMRFISEKEEMLKRNSGGRIKAAKPEAAPAPPAPPAPSVDDAADDTDGEAA